MAIELVFETHSTTVDNEQGHATGWLPGQLSERGRAQAQQLGRRRLGDGITAVFCSDLTRAAETASVAFGTSGIPVLYDWRLRECDYGQRNGMPVAELQATALERAADPPHRSRRHPMGPGSLHRRHPAGTSLNRTSPGREDGSTGLAMYLLPDT